MAVLLSLGHAVLAQNSHTLLLVLPASGAGLEGFVRIVNDSDRSGAVGIRAVDDDGNRFDPVSLALDAKESVNFSSRDLERGDASKGLPIGVGDGTGHWRLELETELDVLPLAYVRTADGLATMHDVVPSMGLNHYVAFFNPGSNRTKQSWLRLINPGDDTTEVTITGLDDAGEAAPGGEVRLTLPAGEARTLTAQTLEAGGEGLGGRLGDGTGKWQLTVTADRAIEAMSLLMSSAHLTNLSTTPDPMAGAPVITSGETFTGTLDARDDVGLLPAGSGR